MFNENGERIPEDPWSSVVDLMSALVLVLFLAVIFFITNYSQVSEDLTAKKNELIQTQKVLNKRSLDLDQTKIALDERSAALEATQLTLNEMSADLKTRSQELEQAQVQINAQTAALEESREKNAHLIALGKEMQAQTERTNADKVKIEYENRALREQIQALQKMKSNMMNAISNELKKAQGVSVDREGGKLIMKSQVLFSKGDAVLTESGSKALGEVARAISKALKPREIFENVEGIMVEGHTSSSGTYERNLKLSADRALNTLNYLLSLPETQRKDLKQFFFAGAFGESRLVKGLDGKENAKLSRRIEIRILFKNPNTSSPSESPR